MLLQAGDLEVRIDRLVGFQQVALRPQPFQRAAQVGGPFHDLELFLANGLLHGVALPGMPTVAAAPAKIQTCIA